jgi:hypothetical protein
MIDTTLRVLDPEVDTLQSGRRNVQLFILYRVIIFGPSYNDIGLCDTSSIASDILWCHLISHC